jgi:hypothetical protein
MSDLDLFDTSAVRDDATSWDALAARITAAAAGARPDSVVGWLASPRAATVTTCLAVGVVVVLLARLAWAPPGADTREDWTSLLAPSDAVGRTFATDVQPPAVGELLRQRGGTR